MALQQKFLDIFKPVLQNPACHQKFERILQNLYTSTEFAEFVEQFLLGLQFAFRSPITVSTPNVDRFLNFMAIFIINIATKHEYEMQKDSTIDEVESHPLLKYIINEVLKFSNLGSLEARFHSCQFIRLLLNQIGDDIQLDDSICDSIVSALLPRIVDYKSQIRREAVLALVRLQDPASSECPVVKAFLDKLLDSNALVRKEAVLNIALNPTSMLKIIERLRDVDPNVRAAAFYKCSQFGPKFIRIIDRQEVLFNGFNDNHSTVKKMFFETMLPKWFSVYDGNILKLLHAIKLDADEIDMARTALLTNKLCEVFFRTNSIKELTDILGLGEDKLIPPEKVSSEQVAYWNALFTHLHKSPELEEYLEDIFPELTQFCNYIESFIKSKSNRTMQLWEKLEYEQIVYSLFKMMGQCDFSDEVGRQTSLKLIKDLLLNVKFDQRILLEEVKVLHSILHDSSLVASEVYGIISQIREQEIEKPTRQCPERKAEQEFKLATMKVELMTLEDKQEQVIQEQNWQLAADLEQQIKELKQNIMEQSGELSTPQVELVKEINSDPETICRCLDILIAVMSLPKLRKLHPALKTAKEDLFDPYVSAKESEIYCRIFRLSILYSLLDVEIAKEQIKFITSPILVYRVTNVYMKGVLLAAVAGVSDLLRVYGTSIFPKDDEAQKNKRKNGRRLYQICDLMEVGDSQEYTLELVIDAMLDILDDDADEIREMAGYALANIIENKIVLSPSLLSRLLLKWFNPITEKQDPKLSQRFGESFFTLAQRIKNGDDVIEQAVIPTLEAIANAPRQSPLTDINTDKMVQILASLTMIDKSQLSNSHKNLSYAICFKIANQPHERCVHLLTKMLLVLDVPTDDGEAIKELEGHIEQILNDVKDKSVVRNLIKYQGKLALAASTLPHSETCETENTAITEITSRTSVSEIRNDSIPERISDLSKDESLPDRTAEVNQTSLITRRSSISDNPRNENGFAKPPSGDDLPSHRKRRRGRPRKTQNTSLHPITEVDEAPESSNKRKSKENTDILEESVRADGSDSSASKPSSKKSKKGTPNSSAGTNKSPTRASSKRLFPDDSTSDVNDTPVRPSKTKKKTNRPLEESHMSGADQTSKKQKKKSAVTKANVVETDSSPNSSPTRGTRRKTNTQRDKASKKKNADVSKVTAKTPRSKPSKKKLAKSQDQKTVSGSKTNKHTSASESGDESMIEKSPSSQRPSRKKKRPKRFSQSSDENASKSDITSPEPSGSSVKKRKEAKNSGSSVTGKHGFAKKKLEDLFRKDKSNSFTISTPMKKSEAQRKITSDNMGSRKRKRNEGTSEVEEQSPKRPSLRKTTSPLRKSVVILSKQTKNVNVVAESSVRKVAPPEKELVPVKVRSKMNTPQRQTLRQSPRKLHQINESKDLKQQKLPKTLVRGTESKEKSKKPSAKSVNKARESTDKNSKASPSLSGHSMRKSNFSHNLSRQKSEKSAKEKSARNLSKNLSRELRSISSPNLGERRSGSNAKEVLGEKRRYSLRKSLNESLNRTSNSSPNVSKHKSEKVIKEKRNEPSRKATGDAGSKIMKTPSKRQSEQEGTRRKDKITTPSKSIRNASAVLASPKTAQSVRESPRTKKPTRHLEALKKILPTVAAKLERTSKGETTKNNKILKDKEKLRKLQEKKKRKSGLDKDQKHTKVKKVHNSPWEKKGSSRRNRK